MRYETKEERWGECRKQVVERLTELSKYFGTGEMAPTRVDKMKTLRRTLQI